MDGRYIEGRKAAPADLGDVLVLGFGKSGRAVCTYCLDRLGDRVKSLTVAAGDRDDDAMPFANACMERGARVVFDTFTFDERYDICIASPGISQFSRFYENAQAASSEIVSEVEFAWRESRSDSRWVAITGTNGKTTTTTLTKLIVDEAGLSAVAVGNIGDTCIEAVAADAADVFVTEASSFQLASTVLFAPDAAVLLNITPDHLYWHMTFEAYVAAKKRVYANLATTTGVLAIDAVTDVSRACVKELASDPARGFSYVPLGCAAGLGSSMKDACGSENAAFVHDGMLRICLGDEAIDLVSIDELGIKGDHNASNALAASCAALALGIEPETIRRALRAFSPLEHRMEPCGAVAGVACVNDSKATNVDATLKAFASFRGPSSLFLLGGHDKGTDLSPLVEAAKDGCKAVVCFGAAGRRFYDAFDGSGVRRVLVEHMEDAFDAALGLAVPGDTVVLSPACSSFDEFDSFEHRGRVFKQLVAFRAGRG